MIFRYMERLVISTDLQFHTETEKEITESIEAISKENKTMFIIAHRITTLKNCDVIYDMADGKIIGTYSYEEIAKTILEN